MGLQVARDPANVDLVFRMNFFGWFDTARALLPGTARVSQFSAMASQLP